MCGFERSWSPALLPFLVDFLDWNSTAAMSLQALGAALLSGFAALHSALLVGCVALFYGFLVIALCTFMCLDALRLCKDLGEIDIAGANSVT
jgi:hypothetical protein